VKLWGGRFEAPMAAPMARLNASIGFDWRLWAADIVGSKAYAKALHKAGILTQQELDELLHGLDSVADEFASERLEIKPSDEDIHTAVERRLGELIGSTAGKLHTGRSRNDQVATDMRLYLMGELVGLGEALRSLQGAIVDSAKQHLDILMPGFTHLQHAQPVRFSHWLLSFFWMLERDGQRLADLRGRVSVLPLGSGALAGNRFDIDREFLAEELGFDSVSQNSMDAVSDRDFVAEVLFWAALLQTHLSRLAEDLVIWSSPEYGFVRLDDAYSSGSSIMPQKRNPDSMELLRGKVGRLVGNLVTMLTLLKGLPSTYNKDLQEDKEPLFDTLDTLALVLPVAAGVISTMTVVGEAMGESMKDAMLATDLAEHLVQQGAPFRASHQLVGRAVKRAELQGVPLSELSIEEYREISDLFDEQIAEVFDHHSSVDAKTSIGGTARQSVMTQIDRAANVLAANTDGGC